jgi:acyl carrier protein
MIPQATRNISFFGRLADVIRDVFGCPDLEVTRDTTSLDVDGWDSLSHTVLLLRVESAFEVRLPLDEARNSANVGELADLLQPLVSPNVTAVVADDDARWIILHGNCQMRDLSELLAPLVVGRGYQVAYVANFEHWQVKCQPEPAQAAKCAVFIQQVAPGPARASGIPPTYKTDFPADCRELRMPVLWLKSLWPLQRTDPRNVRTDQHPCGKHPYGDSQVLQLLKQTTDPAVVFQRYMETDITKLVDLDRLHEMAMAEAVAADRVADLPFAPTLERYFRSARLFDTVNHPSHDFKMLMRDVAAEFIFEGTDDLPPVAEPAPVVQVPVHPQVVEHFRLEWTTPDAKYLYLGHSMTFEEYLRMYIAFD